MKKYIFYLIMILAILMPTNILAQTDNYEPYAVLSEDNTVLTFYYDNKKTDRNGMKIGPYNYYKDEDGTIYFHPASWNKQAENIMSVVFDESFADCTTITSTALWFRDCKNLTSITGINNLITTNVTDMGYMFYGCSSLTSLDLSSFNTANVTGMTEMFYDCKKLASIDLSNFNTANVTDMSSMFEKCSSLTSIDLSGFNSAKVADMASMFEECESLTSLDLSKFNTAKVTNMSRMFGGCGKLREIIGIGVLNTSNVTNMNCMFAGCSSLTYLDNVLPFFDTSNVTDMQLMFYSCSKISSLDLSNFITDKVVDMQYMFRDCINLSTIYAGSRWSTKSIIIGSDMFMGCENLSGEMGTKYDATKTDYTYARFDGGASSPGYFTRGTHGVSINVRGSGYIICGQKYRNTSLGFNVNDGESVSIEIVPDKGYVLKSFTVNGNDEILNVKDNKFTINISCHTNITAIFGPIQHILSIKATGNGSVKYGEMSIRDNTNTFDVTDDNSATLTISPDDGFQLKKLIVNDTDVTSSITDNQYIISNIKADINVEAEFEAIQHTLSIKAIGNGSVIYGGGTIRENTCTYAVNELSSEIITISPDDGYRLYSLIVNDADVTSAVTNNQYTISNIKEDMNIEAVFVIQSFDSDGISYNVASYDDKTINVASGDFGICAIIPSTITVHNIKWTVVGVENGAFNNSAELAAIVWEPVYRLTEIVSNPNLLLYVKSKNYAPSGINNVIVNNVAESIVLTDAASGNNFYCPQDFTAEQIIYEHNYSMKTGYNTCQGWETIVLPFDVTVVSNNQGIELVPYKNWVIGNSQRPFWLYTMDDNGWVASDAIKANIPYIICMPNNDIYNATYNQSGNIAFRASNVKVKASDNLSNIKCGHKIFVPNYQCYAQSTEIFALNVNNLINTYTDSDPLEGSAFIKDLRDVKPFEAYMMIDSNGSARCLSIFGDDGTTGIMDLPMSTDHNRNNKVYTLSGRLIKQGKDDKDFKNLPKGVYIINGKKVIK